MNSGSNTRHVGVLVLAKFTFSEAEMQGFAAKLSSELQDGDIILLEGDLGAGKTSFARALIRYLLHDHAQELHIPSPTFTLVQSYQTDRFEVMHADLYRLGDMSELTELGLFDEETPRITLIEWPERLIGQDLRDALLIRIEGTGEERTVSLFDPGDHWSTRLNVFL